MVVTWTSDSSRVPPEQQIRDSLIRSMDANGATPSRFLELLDAATKDMEDPLWRKLNDRHGRSFLLFTDFVTAERPEGLGLHDKEDLRKHLALRHKEEREPYLRQATVERMAKMRERVGELLGKEVPESNPVGRPRAGEENPSATRFSQPDADYILARLKRDDPTEAQRVISGEITPNAAARAKGWRKPRIILSSPQRVAAKLREHFPDPAQRQLLADLLTQPDKKEDQ